jgi:DNA-binding NtrC family response regulator
MQTKTGKILIVDDDEDILTAGRLLLRRHFEEVITCRNPEDIPLYLEENDIDTVLLDMNFGPGESSGREGLHWLERIKEINPQLVVVMVTAHGSVHTAVEAMKRGATDFVSKPWQNEKVVATLSAAVELHRSRVETEALRKTNRALLQASTAPAGNFISESTAMEEVFSLVSRAAPTDANVLLLGENGTGKELVARELHRQSERSDRVFLSVDLGSISESLFESELFGHRKGAFTGATDDRPGRFQAADSGTLFLDEVGNLPLHLQAKLLSALELREVTPVGSDRAEAVDVRVIAATNVRAEILRDENRFRPDLLFRLNTVEITVPALRERRDDILPIARHYAVVYARKYGKSAKTFSVEAEAAMLAYHWPGNVRALRHAVERAVILSTKGMLAPRDLQLEAIPRSSGQPELPRPERYQSDRELSPRGHLPEPAQTLEQLERDTIERALHRHGFNISHTARELGLTRASLYRRMEKHGL